MALATEAYPVQSHTALAQLLDQHLIGLQVKGYSDYTVRNRFVHIQFFLRWCEQRGITDPAQITSSILQDYARVAFEHRKRNGEPLTPASRYARLVPLRRPLPRNILSAGECARVLRQPNVRTPIGLRDRVILQCCTRPASGGSN